MMSALFSLATITLAAAAPQLPAGDNNIKHKKQKYIQIKCININVLKLYLGLTAAACPNYPYCDATTGFLEIPDVPGAEQVIRAQEQLLR